MGYYFVGDWKLSKQVGLNRLVGDTLKSSKEFSSIQKLCWGCQKFLWSLLSSVYKSVVDVFTDYLQSVGNDETAMSEEAMELQMDSIEKQITALTVTPEHLT